MKIGRRCPEVALGESIVVEHDIVAHTEGSLHQRGDDPGSILAAATVKNDGGVARLGECVENGADRRSSFLEHLDVAVPQIDGPPIDLRVEGAQRPLDQGHVMMPRMPSGEWPYAVAGELRIASEVEDIGDTEAGENLDVACCDAM